MIAALYVDTAHGPYPRIPGVVAWSKLEDLLARSVSVSIGPFYEEEDLDDVMTGLQKVAHHLVGK